MSDKSLSSNVLRSITSEAVSFITQAGAADAGEAAGTVVLGQLAYDKVLNLPGSDVGLKAGNSISSSLVFTTGVMDSTLEVAWDYSKNGMNAQIANMITVVGAGANGSWALDYNSGQLVIKKKTTGTSQTITSYKVRSSSSSSSGGVSADDNSAFTPGSSDTTPIAALVDEVSTGSVTEGNSGALRMTATRELRTAETYAPSYEDNTNQVAKVEQRFSSSYISTATTTTIKSGAGFVHTITITEAVASTIIVYDNTAGSGSIIASFVASAGVGTYHLNVAFGTGLTIVTAGASKLTTSYR